MSETATDNKTTRLILMYSSDDKSRGIREKFTNIPSIIQRCGYKFQIETPLIVVEPSPKRTEKYINWRGKERERVIFDRLKYVHILIFSKPLTEEELTFWRIFKLGYMTRELSPALTH